MSGLPTVPVHAIDPQPDAPQWLIRDLWSAAAVGVIGGLPKSCKSWFGLDLAVSVASATAALDRFEVLAPGPALVYLAEDFLPRVRERVAHLCRHRGLDLGALDLHVVTAATLRLDHDRDQHALDDTLGALRPALLLLDPLVRLHRLDENSAVDIAALLGFLRELNRRHQVALILVHHLAKRSRRNLGQALRGSSDLHAWTDSACYLARRGDGRLLLSVEHRSAPAPDPVLLRLHGGGHQPLALRLDGHPTAPPSLAEAVRAALQEAAGRCQEPPCVNGCASTIPVSAMPCSNWNNTASPSATAAAGACLTERPSSRRPSGDVPSFLTGTHSERNAASDRPHDPAHKLPAHSPDVGNPRRPGIVTLPRQFPLTRSRDSRLPDRGR